jgi:PIN domain nuclease of toxin-antitoxin system
MGGEVMQLLLLDTCAVIWIAENQKLAPAAVEALNDANDVGVVIYISPITAWEIGMLASRDRVKLLINPQRWFARLFEADGVKLSEMSPDVLIAASFLPGTPPRDPADRIIIATARDRGCTLITRDRLLLDYAEQGHVSVLAC